MRRHLDVRRLCVPPVAAETFERSLAGLKTTEVMVTFAPPAPPPPTPHELELDEDARTGRPRHVVITFDGMDWYGNARVVKNGPGEYSFEPLSKMRRRLTPLPNPDPKRLPA